MKTKLFVQTVVLLAVFVIFGTVPSSAQVLYGSLVGTVTDGSGAVIPGASISAINTETGFGMDSSSGGDGLFRIVNVQIGNYDVTVTSDGFRTHNEANVTISANSVARVDIALVIGQVTEQVTVEATASQLQTEKADTRAEITEEAIINFPLPNFRNYQSLINLVPGATPARFQNSILDTPARSLSTNVNGTNRNNNVTRIDGAASINVWLPHHAGYIAPAETIETVSITTGAGDAEQGLSGGSSTTVITKSGTNEFHGSGFYFFDNDGMRAREYFAGSKPESSFKNFGATIGGPIVQNKVFFFFSYDNTSQNVAGVRTNDTVPTADQRRGDFSAYDTQIFNPYTGNQDGTGRIPFVNATIPSHMLSPISLAVQSYYPEPTHPGTSGNFHSQDAPPFARAYFDPKLNFNLTDKYSMWAKYGFMDAPVSGTPIFGEAGGPAPGGSPGSAETFVNLATFGHTYVFSPTFLYDGVFGFWRQDQTVTPADFGKDFNLGIPGIGGPDPRQKGFPNIRPGGGYTNLGSPGWQPLERVEENWTTSQNFTLIKGTHQIRFGFDGILLKLTHWQPELNGGPRGVIDFSGDITALKGGASPNDFNTRATFLLGNSWRMRKAIQHILATGREWQFAGYATDRWQLNQRVTLNLGVRYEYYPLMTRAGGKGIERYDPETNLMYLGGRGNVPLNAGIEVSSGLISPRAGLAIRVDDKTVIRGGFGLNYSPMPFSRPMRGQYPLTVGETFQRPNSFELFRQLSDGIPPVVGPELTTGVLEVPFTVGFRSPYEKLDRGYISSWNFTLERRMPLDIITSVAYVGTKSVGMLADRDINASRPGEGNSGRPYASITGRTQNINMWDSYLNSDYHSLQVAINRSAGDGLMLKGAYTFSKAINMADDEGWAGVEWDHLDVWDRNRARAGYDRTHMFQMGFVYDLPFLNNSNSAMSVILGNWQISGIAAVFTGRPTTIRASSSSLNAASARQTADQVGAVVKLGNFGPGQKYYDPSAFAAVTEQRFGTSGRNIIDHPGVTNLDFSLFKKFPVGESVEAQIRAEAFNLTNTPQFGSFQRTQSSSQFMEVRSASNNRVVRLGLRFEF